MSTYRHPAQTVKLYYRVDRREIAFIKFILEAYDGLAIVKTLNPATGFVTFNIAPGCEKDLEMLLQDLKRDILMEPASPIEN